LLQRFKGKYAFCINGTEATTGEACPQNTVCVGKFVEKGWHSAQLQKPLYETEREKTGGYAYICRQHFVGSGHNATFAI
jgi:hypothetical protein